MKITHPDPRKRLGHLIAKLAQALMEVFDLLFAVAIRSRVVPHQPFISALSNQMTRQIQA
jgi:uncharacterized protein YbjT (DUF2867 family)